ncbi:hypothetical protein GGC63_005154 [Paenibacillus sp. OAS669]|nr:hypothetical protein [Paenibacillus sp. OAS669]
MAMRYAFWQCSYLNFVKIGLPFLIRRFRIELSLFFFLWTMDCIPANFTIHSICLWFMDLFNLG